MTVTKSNTTTGFADESSLTRTIVFSAGDFVNTSTIADINVTVSFAKSNNDSFVAESSSINSGTPYYNEIDLVLTSPDNTTIKLISNSGDDSFDTGDNPGFQGTITFDQDAATEVNTDRDNITAGTFRPADEPGDSLNDFNDESAIGTWTLEIEDNVEQDGLSFYSYSVTVTTVPEPDNISLWGTLIVAVIMITLHRPRRRREAHPVMSSP